MKKYNILPNKNIVDETIMSLNQNGIDAYLFNSGEEIKMKLFEIIPKGSEVMTMTSVTLDTLGISDEIQKSGEYDSVRNKMFSMDRNLDKKTMKQLGTVPDYAIGSAHAVTKDGKIIIASNTGSQLPAYIYGANNVIFIIGIQKIVKDLSEGLKRIYDYTLPLESERIRKVHGSEGSFVSKLLIINREIIKNRITVLFINEVIGF